jgi:hypothetical protein
MRLATVRRNAENQQQRSLQENWNQQSQLHVYPTIDCRIREVRGPAECFDRNLTALSPGVHLQRGPTTGRIIPVADDNALSRELIRELLEGSGQVAEKSGFRQISWYRPHSLTFTLSALQLLEINHNVAQTPVCGLFDSGDQAFHGSAH